MSGRDACGCRIPATVRRRTEIREYPRLAERHSVTKTALFPSLRHHAPPPLRMASPAASAIPPQTRQSVNRILHASAFLPEEKTHPKPRFSTPARSPKTALRQEISVFAERNIFLSAKKSALYRSPDCIYAVTIRIYAAFMEYSCPPVAPDLRFPIFPEDANARIFCPFDRKSGRFYFILAIRAVTPP